jgi:hypothetical protein
MQRRRSTLVLGLATVVGLAGVSAATGAAAKKPKDPAAG